MTSMDDIYRNYSDMLFRYLLSLCGDESLAEELTQETFYQAVRSADHYDGTCKVTTWLCAIAKNKWKEYLRKHPATEEFEESLFDRAGGSSGTGLPHGAASGASAESDYFSNISKLEIHKAIHQLPDNTREVVQLRIFGDLSFKEIAEVMDRTEEWARVTYYRGKLALRKELTK